VDRVEGGAAGFSDRAAEKLGWYVYLLVDPRSGRPLLVGRGRDDRCFDHLRAARGADEPGSTRFAALDRIRAVEAAGRPVRIDILRHGLDGPTASVVEAAVAEALGLPNGAKAPDQRVAASAVEAVVAKRARFKRGHPSVLLRVADPGAGLGYEEVRHGWRVGRRWTDPSAARSPRWAVVVDGELVVDVYRLTGWDATPRSGPEARAARPAGGPGVLVERYSFVGARDAELARRYVGRSVAPWLGPAPGPVTYVWCGPNWVPSDR
jgi:hypothetical protein